MQVSAAATLSTRSPPDLFRLTYPCYPFPMPRSQIRTELLVRLSRTIRARMPDAPDPDALAEVALEALPDACEWLLRVAEHYQRRAHVAEGLLARPGMRPARRRLLRLFLPD